jgi:hypothetical protein
MLRAYRAPKEVLAEVTVPKGIPAAEAGRAVKDSPGAAAEGAVKAAVRADQVGADPEARAAAVNANISGRKKFAGSASSAWTSSTTRKPKCSSRSSRSGVRFFLAA